MKDYETKNIKSVVVLGHTGAGKTEVLESVLFNTKVTDRFGKAVDGTSIIDSDAEEQKRGMSVYTHVVPVEWAGQKINFLDTHRLSSLDSLFGSQTGCERSALPGTFVTDSAGAAPADRGAHSIGDRDDGVIKGSKDVHLCGRHGALYFTCSSCTTR